MKRLLLAVAATLVASGASAGVPVFAAKCLPDLNVDADRSGKVYIHGKVAKLVDRPDGQITARSGGVYIDITPQGDQPPMVAYKGQGQDRRRVRSDVLQGARPRVRGQRRRWSGGIDGGAAERTARLTAPWDMTYVIRRFQPRASARRNEQVPYRFAVERGWPAIVKTITTYRENRRRRSLSPSP